MTMERCKLKKGDRIYECRYHEATLTELITDPELLVQGEDSHYWHWEAKVIESNAGVEPGDVISYGITEEAPAYGPCLYRQNIYAVGRENAERLLPPFDTSERGSHEIRRCSITDDIEILGHVFHGLKDIQTHVEMSLYKSYSRGEANARDPKQRCDVHVGEMWMPYPCFDSSDFANESRDYQNFIFRGRPITQEDMKKLSELPSLGNECRITENVPTEMLPMVYYVGDGDVMLVKV